MNKIQKKQLISILLLLVIVFALGNLIYNVERLEIGEEITLDQEGDPGGQSYLASSSSMAQTVRYIVQGLLGIGIAITIGSIIYGMGTKNKVFLKSMVYLMIAGVVVIILFISLFTFNPVENIEYLHNERLDTGYTTGNGTTNATNPTSNDKPDGMEITISIMVIGGAIALLVLIVYSIAQLTYLRSDSISEDIDAEAMAEEVGLTIQRTMDDMASGTDVRSSIIRCYADMCKLAAQYGISDEKQLTPREFEAMIGTRLPVASEKLHDLILIFEEARYSDHDLLDDMKDRALGALGTIRDELAIKLAEDNEAMSVVEETDRSLAIEPSVMRGDKDGQ